MDARDIIRQWLAEHSETPEVVVDAFLKTRPEQVAMFRAYRDTLLAKRQEELAAVDANVTAAKARLEAEIAALPGAI